MIDYNCTLANTQRAISENIKMRILLSFQRFYDRCKLTDLIVAKIVDYKAGGSEKRLLARCTFSICHYTNLIRSGLGNELYKENKAMEIFLSINRVIKISTLFHV